MAGNGNSGRPSLPASVHLLSGNRSKLSPAQLMNEIKDPAVPVGVPPMPDFLTGDAAAEWVEITEALLALGWVSRLDKMALATYCKAYGDWVRYERMIAELNAKSADGLGGEVQTYKTGARQVDALRTMADAAAKRANTAGAWFGLSPLARRNMRAAAPAGQGELFPNAGQDAAAKYFS
ncbi:MULTISPECIES: phage terminase small subunit P27 family [Pseudomonas]|uniref:phage terminase small subunit P27 family n=1 Tax=Pseudomonas guariconensis TaxID=1288410 RepID=UPI0020982C55|nr:MULTISPECIES: phage terminase small subunit P27 family [Pseudomonas]MCO7594259.1 phage terminase small subunit P27 family [Pseudomonas guariconensis]MCU7220014.1 phage terminase small subunit P27 family [Pseudomonas brassicacearum]